MPDDQQATDEKVLADPGAFNVAEVLDVFSRATPEQIHATQLAEQGGKSRQGIVEFVVPAAEPDIDADPEPAPAIDGFIRERILDPSEGPAIVGFVEELGRGAKHPEIVGALDGDDSPTFTAGQVRSKIAEFLARPMVPAGATEEG